MTKIKNKKCQKELIPYYRHFKGGITKIDENTFQLSGNFHIDKKDIIITELYPGMSTQSYKEFLMKLEESKKIISFTDNNTDQDIYFQIKINKIPNSNEEIYTLFKLRKTFIKYFIPGGLKKYLINLTAIPMKEVGFEPTIDLSNRFTICHH